MRFQVRSPSRSTLLSKSVDTLRCIETGVFTMLPNQDLRATEDVEIGDHGFRVTQKGCCMRSGTISDNLDDGAF